MISFKFCKMNVLLIILKNLFYLFGFGLSFYGLTPEEQKRKLKKLDNSIRAQI